MPEATENEDNGDAKSALWVKAKCEMASIYLAGLADPNDHDARPLFERHRNEAVASALSINDEFYQGVAIHQVIKLCREANDLDTARTLLRKVDDDFLREQILKDAPELAGEKKKRLPDDQKAGKNVTINLDQLDREAIVLQVVTAMREVGAPEREVEGFERDASKADYDTLLAKAIGWGAPVRFLKDGKPWARGDWRRLTTWQRIQRRFILPGGSYTRPDGTLELDIDEKAGVDPFDADEVKEAKLDRYFARLPGDRSRNLGSMFVSLAVFLLAIYFGLPVWLSVAIAVLIGAGLHLLITGRWPK